MYEFKFRISLLTKEEIEKELVKFKKINDIKQEIKIEEFEFFLEILNVELQVILLSICKEWEIKYTIVLLNYFIELYEKYLIEIFLIPIYIPKNKFNKGDVFFPKEKNEKKIYLEKVFKGELKSTFLIFFDHIEMKNHEKYNERKFKFFEKNLKTKLRTFTLGQKIDSSNYLIKSFIEFISLLKKEINNNSYLSSNLDLLECAQEYAKIILNKIKNDKMIDLMKTLRNYSSHSEYFFIKTKDKNILLKELIRKNINYDLEFKKEITIMIKKVSNVVQESTENQIIHNDILNNKKNILKYLEFGFLGNT